MAKMKPQARRASRRAAPPQAAPMSRLAMVKLRPEAPPPPPVDEATRRRRLGAWTGVVLLMGAAVAGASWIGGSLVDAREGLAASLDGAVAEAGFPVARITVEGEGLGAVRTAEVRAAASPPDRRSLFAATPEEVKARVESLDWVSKAEVRRLWPDRLHVVVERRQAVAVWQVGGRAVVIGADGTPAPQPSKAALAQLPLLVGRGADRAAPDLLAALEAHADLRHRVAAFVRVGERRWDLRLRSGAVVALPEAPAADALARYATLERGWRLSGRPLARIDMRSPVYVALTPRHVLAGGPALAGA